PGSIRNPNAVIFNTIPIYTHTVKFTQLPAYGHLLVYEEAQDPFQPQADTWYTDCDWDYVPDSGYSGYVDYAWVAKAGPFELKEQYAKYVPHGSPMPPTLGLNSARFAVANTRATQYANGLNLGPDVSVNVLQQPQHGTLITTTGGLFTYIPNKVDDNG